MASTHQCLCLALLLVVAVADLSVTCTASENQGVPMSVRHERWMVKFGRTYKDASEKERRFKVFKANAEYIELINRAENRTYTLGLNQFSDLTDDEFRETYLGYQQHDHPEKKPVAPSATPFKHAALEDSVPESIDWRAQGAVTAIKNQRTCGCCWAFAAVAATEGIVQIATGNLISLSEQQVLDCTGGDNTCDGGNVGAALKYIEKSGGLQTESSYPYKGTQRTCQSTSPNSVASISSFRKIHLAGDEDALQGAAANQPVAVAIESSEPDFRHYRGGVYAGSETCGQSLDHAVTVVGYGTADDGTQYWLLKNQWGTSWGERGYMRIARGANCGLATYVYYPTIDN